MNFTALIPARLASTRLRRKVLADLGGKPLVAHVHERARESGAERVVIATDAEEVAAACRRFGAEVCMTAATHASGTDRIAEAAARLGLSDETIVVNVQGDEPEIPAGVIRAVARGLEDAGDCDLATAAQPVATAREFADPHAVKVVVDAGGRALYFSRAPIPWARSAYPDVAALLTAEAELPRPAPRRHIGIYAYRALSLRALSVLPPYDLEVSESLEQLRALAHGFRIKVIDVDDKVPPGIDTPADLEAARQRLAGR